MKPLGSGAPLVIDTSAWNRQTEPQIRERWKATARAGLLVSCPVAALEILSATRDEREFAAFEQGLGALPQAPVTASVGRAALGASRDLGARRRIPVAGLSVSREA